MIGWLHNLLPPLRRPFSWTAVVPLGVFSFVLAVVIAWLELGSHVTFGNRMAFFMLLALPWLWWLHLTGFHGLSGFRSQLALQVRFALAALFAMALADPRAVRKSDDMALIYVLDISDSVGETSADAALEYIVRTATEKPPNDRAGLVVSGRNAGIELPCRKSFPFEAINSRIQRDGTNLQKSLSLANALLPDGAPGRICLISDGTQTEGDAEQVLDQLRAREVAVDVLPIQYDYQDEVWLEKLELPRIVKQGETYEASVVLSSLRPGVGTLALIENGTEITRQEVVYGAGKTRYTLPLYLRKPGYYEYVARIDTPEGKDGWEENNIAISFLFLKGQGRVLLVTDPGGDERDWQVFRAALQDAKMAVDVCEAFDSPWDALALMPYDSVVFVNVPAEAFDFAQLQAVKDAVYTQGTGFLMIGGRNSFGAGGYQRTPIADALPVDLDIKQRRVMPKGALAIILHTCEFAEGNTWGKRIAKEAVRVLGVHDEAGILAFDWQGGEKWVAPMTPLTDYEKIIRLINQAQIGDMPSFATTMTLGLEGLKKSDAAAKHMIIISDGDPSPPPPPLVDKFIKNRITVSTVAIFPHGGREVATLRQIAEATGGRYYFPSDPNELPAIFIKEAKTLRRTLIQEKEFHPEVDFPSSVVKGMDAFPPLRGLVLTTPKPRARVVLRAPNKEEVDPVLVIWRYGVGKVGAFTSDLSPKWGQSWVGWDRYRAFVKQLMTAIGRETQETKLGLHAFAAGATGVIVVDDYQRNGGMLDMQAQVGGPEQRTVNVPLRQVGPSRYEGRFPLWGKGRYRVLVAGSDGTREERIVGGLVVPYSPEYLRFRSTPVVLERIASATGGRVLTGRETGLELFPEEREMRTRSRPIILFFLIVLACLIPLDVGVRRIQLEWSMFRAWFGRARPESHDKTFSKLLRRKEAVQFGSEEAGEGTLARLASRVDAQRTQAANSAAKQAAKATKTEAKPEANSEGEDQPASTTGQLLARKKKWK